jgi:hypothetical protein
MSSRTVLLGAILVLGIVHSAAAQFPIDLSRLHEASAMVLKLPEGSVREVNPATKSITLPPGGYVIAKTADRATQVASPPEQGPGFQLPITLATVGAAGAQIALGVFVRTGNGLMPRGPSSFEGRIFVGLINTLDPLTAIKLPAPVQVTLAGPVDSITPDQPQFDTTNTFLPITLIARDPRNPVQLRVSTGVEITETVVSVPVVNASVSVVSSVPSLAGFGFETTDVTVQAHGMPAFEGMPVTLFLQGGSGSFEPSSQLKLDANGRATARLRSSGLSSRVVVAATLSTGATTQAEPIEYTWPTLWLAFAIGGGIVGCIIRQLSGTRRAWFAALTLSVALGLIAAALYVLGVSTVTSIPAGTGGQLVLAVVAALSAIAGVSGLPIPKH